MRVDNLAPGMVICPRLGCCLRDCFLQTCGPAHLQIWIRPEKELNELGIRMCVTFPTKGGRLVAQDGSIEIEMELSL